MPRKKKTVKSPGGDRSRKHHYLQRALLSHFRSDASVQSVWVFDKHRRESFLSSLDDAASEKDFNSVQIGDERVVFENAFDQIDSVVPPAVGEVLRTRDLARLSAGDRDVLALGAACQLLRVKQVRTSFQAFADQLRERLVDRGHRVEAAAAAVPPVSDQVSRLLSIQALGEMEARAISLRKKDLILLEAPPGSEFMTSDSPIVLLNRAPYGALGLDAREVEVYWPLAPSLVIGFWCSSIGRTMARRLQGTVDKSERAALRSMLVALKSGSLAVSTEGVALLNHLQVSGSLRFLYARRDGFSQAERILSIAPDLSEVRSRATLGRLGEWPVLGEYPPGDWLVVFGHSNQYVLRVLQWAEGAGEVEFVTTCVDDEELAVALADTPIESVQLQTERVGRFVRGVELSRCSNSSSGAQLQVRHSDASQRALTRAIRNK